MRKARPHILMIVADDLGWSSLSSRRTGRRSFFKQVHSGIYEDLGQNTVVSLKEYVRGQHLSHDEAATTSAAHILSLT